MAFGWLFNDNQTHLIPYSNFLVRLHASVAKKVFYPPLFAHYGSGVQTNPFNRRTS